MKYWKIICLLCFLIAALSSSAQKKEVGARPNIIVICADDLGWKEVSAFGNTRIKTPHIDSLGIRGTRFTQAYACAPICSPGRAGLLTGRYQNRFGFEFLVPENLKDSSSRPVQAKHLVVNNNVGKFSLNGLVEPGVDPESFRILNSGIPETEITLAEALKSNGYTTGIVGKWHLGESEGFYPTENGFDYFYGCLGWGTMYAEETDNNVISKPRFFERYLFPETRAGIFNIVRNKDSVQETRYLTDAFADEAVKFISTNKNKPFFLYLPFNAVHDPLQAKKEDFDATPKDLDSSIRIQLAMTKNLDDAVGKIIATLKALKIEDNTIVFFTSDNGGPTYFKTVDNSPLKGGKLSHFEGGIRVSYFIQYPSKIPAGKVYNKVVSNLDIFSTAMAAANAVMPDKRQLDGVNLIPYVNGANTAAPHDELCWRNGYSKAIRKGDWKLYMNDRKGVQYLYNLKDDSSETTDLSEQHPEKVKELLEDFKKWEEKTVKPSWQNIRNVLLPVGDDYFYFPI